MPIDNWRPTLEALKRARRSLKAPVDSIGCHMLADTEDERVFRFQTLVALMLSSQTRDQATAEAMALLKRNLPGGLNPSSLGGCDVSLVEDCIRKVSFYRRKARYLQRMADMSAEKYNGDIPRSLEGLQEIPGVGPKMAYLTMQCAWNESLGIGVDVHVHRIASRLGWASGRTPEHTRRELEEWLPREHWSEVNSLLVGFGQTVCKAVKPRCQDCPVSAYCPSRRV